MMNIAVSFSRTKRRIITTVDHRITVLEMKQKLYDLMEGKEKIVPEKQHLIYGGNSMEDSRKLTEYGVTDKSILLVCPRFVYPESEIKEFGKLYITVASASGERKKYVITSDATIEDLKIKIQDEGGMEATQQRLMHKGRQVHVGFLSSLAKRAEIEFSLRPKGVISLRLGTETGEDLVYNIPDSASIRNIRAAIMKHEEYKMDIKLVFNGEILDDNLTLGDYESVEICKGYIGYKTVDLKMVKYQQRSEIFLIGGRRSLYCRPQPTNDKPRIVTTPEIPKTTKKSIFSRCFG